MEEYKRIQMEFEDRNRPNYNLEPVYRTPVEEFYSEQEHTQALALLRQLLLLENVRTVLVGGVGAGADLRFWLTHLPLEWGIGLDFSIEALRATDRFIHLNSLPEIVEFVRADFEDIPLASNSVDLGIMVHTLHHAFDPQRGFQELWRVSQRGVLLIEPIDTPVTRLFTRLGMARDIEAAGNKVIRFRLEQLLEWAGAECKTYQSRTVLSYYHPLIYRYLLPIFDSNRGLNVFRFLYRISNALLTPFRSKMATVIVKMSNNS